MIRFADWLPKAATWLLWLGVFFLWIAIGLGEFAKDNAPHISKAYLDQYDHEEWAYITGWIFSALAVSKFYSYGFKPGKIQPWKSWVSIIIWTSGVATLAVTGYYGGRLVFVFGVGVGNQ